MKVLPAAAAMKTAISLLIGLCLPIVSANAAEIRWEETTTKGKPSVITVTGVLDPDDDKTFRGIAAASEEAFVYSTARAGP